MIELDKLSDEDLAFRHEVRAFFDEKLTPELAEAGAKTTWYYSEFEYGRAWQRILYERGWGAPHWPVEYGGCDWSPTQYLIWAIENAVRRPPQVMNNGRDLCAPCIMKFGTEEQKAFYLPRIISGEDWWAQGWSEPGAGSDLAALSLSAVPDGDDYVVNGSKIWTTYAQHANRIFCLARTSREAKKQAGLSFLLIDMDRPGISVRPIHDLSGTHEFNQVFFNDVRTPKSSRLGEEGEGWTVTQYVFHFEHGGGIDGIEMRRRFQWLEEIAALESDGAGSRLIDSPEFAKRLAEVAVEVEASDAVTEKLVAVARSGEPPTQVGEIVNLRRRELGQKLSQLLMEALGPYAVAEQLTARSVGGGPPVAGPAHAVLPTAFFLAQRAFTIAGGTSEIHRNNIARHVLKI